MCYLAYTDEEGRVIDDDNILLTIMTTLCPTSRNDFLIYKPRTDSIQRWDSTELIKNFWCVPEKSITNMSDLFKKRLQFFDRYQWIYDDSRCIPRDTHNPGNKSLSMQSKNYKNAAIIWKLRKGPRKIENNSDIDLQPENNPRLRAARVADSARNSKDADDEKQQAEADKKKASILAKAEAKKQSDQENKIKAMQDKLMQELEISKKVRLALEKEKAENKRLSEALMSSKKANPMKRFVSDTEQDETDLDRRQIRRISECKPQTNWQSRKISNEDSESFRLKDFLEAQERYKTEEHQYEFDRLRRRKEIEDERERERSQERRQEKMRDERHRREMSEERLREKIKRNSGQYC